MMVFLRSQKGLRLPDSPRLREGCTAAGYALAGFFTAAASLGNRPQPLTVGMLLGAAPGWPLLCLGLGSAAGYLVFWGPAALTGILWTAAALLAAGILAALPPKKLPAPVLPLLAAGLTAAAMLALMLRGRESVSLPEFFLPVVLAAGSAWIYPTVLDHREPLCDWLAQSLGVLSLAQLGFPGFAAAGILGAAAPFPAAVLAGLSLDLAQVTRTPMTAVLTLTVLLRLMGKKVGFLAPALAFFPVMLACGTGDWSPLPGLLTGGILSRFLPGSPARFRRSPTGLAQVRLELAAGVLDKTRQALTEQTAPPVDGQALTNGAVSRACGSCPCRSCCREQEKMKALDGEILKIPLVSPQDLPVSCRRPGRIWAQLKTAQDQFRLLRADHARQTEYRQAAAQQYGFLGDYLRELSDSLPRREPFRRPRFSVTVAARTRSRLEENGDRCTWFPGPEGLYFVILCDGMGTGSPACRESEQACELLKSLLKSGFPPKYALKSLNSLCILRGASGAVSVDLAALEQETGKCTLYKWGAPPSYLLRGRRTEQIGTAVPPPGLSVQTEPGSRERLSLRRGERLVLLSDGAGGEAALNRVGTPVHLPPEALAEEILANGPGEDDATAAVIQLIPLATGTE